jgi:hypothetical protein
VTASESSATASESSTHASPPDPEGAKSIAARVLDVLVYLPAGAVLTTLEDVPDTIDKGRARVDQELRNAKVVGRFVVNVGLRQLKSQLDSLSRGAGGTSGAASDDEAGPRPAGAPVPGRAQTVARDRHREPGPTPPGVRPRPTTPSRDPEVDRAIPDYDILAASQVVRRLDGLGHDELAAVVRHEGATRGRRTILHRAEQLLGTAGHDRPGSPRPGPDGPGAPGASGVPGHDPTA